ncbi:MAG: tyrosine-type recombinase/integrase [Herbinix sp.]|jgi:integrase|nr:tyrosine-type recombinase/integrase [Herbinix sp.]
MGKDLKGKELGEGLRQAKDERYIARFTNRFGKRVEIKGKDLKEVKTQFNKAIYEDKQKMNLVDDSTILDDWYEQWLSVHKYKVIRANTKRHYNTVYRKHISPTLGKRKLKDITQLQIKALINQLDKDGYKYETQNKVRILLLDMFNKAMIDNFVNKNPAKGIKLERDEKIDPKVLTPEEQAEFFECSKGTFYDNLFVVAVSTGLRPGELCALTWDDIDLDNMEINVDKTLLYQKLEGDEKKEFHVGPPKTKQSKRKVPITKQCKTALLKQKMQNNVIMSRAHVKAVKGLDNFLFTTKFGTPINSQIYCDAIEKIVDEINLCRDTLDEFERFSPHCLRHTFATRCFEADIQPKTVQKYLGHATLQMTMDLYTHVLEKHKTSEMSKLENALDGLLDVSDDVVEKRYDEYLSKETENDNVIYLKATNQ